MLAWIIAFACAAILYLAGVGHDIEKQLQNSRAKLLDRPASGQIVIVEIDAASLQTLDSWPWPREYYARAVDKLSQAGAAQIAFDVDFSSRSTTRQDQIFADAIANSDATIILPTFRQKNSPTSEQYVESEPIEVLREHAFIASANIHPDAAGQLSQYSFGIRTGGLARPSIASMLAERSANIDGSFAIDQTIDPASIPRVSFAELLSSDGSDMNLSGKKIIIGATAIELGDRYSLRRFGVMPGVVVQALAAETLIQSADMPVFGGLAALLFASLLLAAIMMTGRLTDRIVNLVVIGIGLGLVALVLVSEYYLLATFSNVPAFFFLLIFAGLRKFFSTAGALETSQLSSEASGLPNQVAMQQFILKAGGGNIVAARLSDFTDLLVLTNWATRRDLFANLAGRLKFLALDEQIFHLDANTIGWIVKEDYQDDIPGHFETAMALLQSPFMAGEKKVKIGGAFGISKQSIDRAKVAAEQAYGKDQKWAWDNDQANTAIGLRQILLVELEEAILNDDLHVVYQPKWNLRENRLHGVEALVRWEHPEHGIVSPDIFIPALEKSGQIGSLTMFVLQRALADVSAWSAIRPGLGCAINISARLLGDSKFVRQALALVEHAGVRNEQITFEVTETAAFDDLELSILALGRIREAGIKISIDDYGTGLSTLSYLQRLPVDEIKIDQSFVKTMTTDKGNRVLVESTIRMAHALDLTVVAEGIEDAECMKLLDRLHCDFGQGWHISRPVTAVSLVADWLSSDAERTRMSA